MFSLKKIFGTKEYNHIWCNLDLCGLLCFEFGEVLLFFAMMFIIKGIIPVVSGLFVIRILLYFITLFIYSNAVISHFRCAFSDPGSVPSNATYLPDCIGEDRILFCPKCDAYKPPRAHHCSTCNRCIVRMDHHCPWTNNCIGYRNMKYFVLFLAYTMAMCIYSFFMVAARLYFVYRFAGEVDDTNTVILCMTIISLCCIFLGFTGSMLSETMESISHSTTKIDRLKGQNFATEGESSFRDYFGERGNFSLRWFFPVSPRFIYLDQIRQYQLKIDIEASINSV